MKKKKSSDMDIYTQETSSEPKKSKQNKASKPRPITNKRKRRNTEETSSSITSFMNKRKSSPVIRDMESKSSKTKKEKVAIKKTKPLNKTPMKKLKISKLHGILFQIDITNPYFSGSKYRGTVDCVICTLEALGIISLSQGQNQREHLTSKGVSVEQILHFMKNRYSWTEWNFERVFYHELENFLKNEIRPNHAIFAALSGPGSESGHAVVFYRTKNGKLGLMDFQANPVLTIVGYEKINNEYLEKNNFDKNHFHVLTYKFA